MKTLTWVYETVDFGDASTMYNRKTLSLQPLSWESFV